MRLYQKIGRRTHPCRHCPQIASFFPSHCLTVTLFWISQEVEQLTQRWSVLGPENSPTEQGEQGGHIVTSLDSIYSQKSFWAIVKLVVVMILFFSLASLYFGAMSGFDLPVKCWDHFPQNTYILHSHRCDNVLHLFCIWFEHILHRCRKSGAREAKRVRI